MFELLPVTMPGLSAVRLLSPNEIGAVVAQFHADGVYGWPLLGGGYQSVADWEKRKRNEWYAHQAALLD